MSRQRKLPAGMTLRGKVYYANFRAQGRKIRKRLSSDFNVAKELLNDLRSRSDRADFGLVDNDYSWKDLKAEFLRWARQSNRTHEDYEQDLRKLEEYQRVRSVRQIDHSYVLGFRQWRLAEVCPRTVNKQVGTLINMLGKGVAWGRIGSNQIAGIKPLRHDKPVKQRRSLSVEEVESLFDESPECLRNVWRLLLTTGVRLNEMKSMVFDDVDFERREVVIQAHTAKNHKERAIPLDDEMLTIIARLRDEAPGRQPIPGRTLPGRLSHDNVFVNSVNTPWGSNLLNRFYTMCKRAEIEGGEPGGSIDIHALRVSFTTLALGYGADPKSIQAILGHSTLALTMGIYAKATDQSKRAAISAIPFAKISSPDHIIPMQNGPKVDTSNSAEPKTLCFTG